MRIVVITSCTGQKRVHHERQLTINDFREGAERVRIRSEELHEFLTPAEQLYTGQQHVRLMRGIRDIRCQQSSNDIGIDLYIVSAGYGLVRGDQILAPYECTFQGMNQSDIVAWARHLDLPGQIEQCLAGPYDLAFILLGDAYLRAVQFTANLRLSGPTLLFCGASSAKQIPQVQNLRIVPLGKEEARFFSAGLVSLKGEVAALLLSEVAHDSTVLQTLSDSTIDVLSLVQPRPKSERNRKLGPLSNPAVDHVIKLSDEWRRMPHRDRLRYFIPDWDDFVDPDYDFKHDTASHGSSDRSNSMYAHQLYGNPQYDGLLVSRAMLDRSSAIKQTQIGTAGIHRYLRVPEDFPIMGDCGAFGYIAEAEPPYTTIDILDYYTRLGFNYGVSIDHLVVAAFEEQKQFRYDLTIHRAEEFLHEHRRLGLSWEPIGAIQGWDAASYADAARQYVAMGYRYIGLGGLVRTQTMEILRVLQAVHRVVPDSVKIHVFGLARFEAIQSAVELGVTSIDSASLLRKAWLGSDRNYLTPDGWYSAVRIPQSTGSFRAKKVVAEGTRTFEELSRLEESCLLQMRRYAEGSGSPSDLLIDHLTEYDTLVAGERPGTRERIRRTLEHRPWETCGCAICNRWGVEVVIFRGNNRNRRRGFHNTHVFYHMLDRLINGESIAWLTRLAPEPDQSQQLDLFSDHRASGFLAVGSQEGKLGSSREKENPVTTLSTHVIKT